MVIVTVMAHNKKTPVALEENTTIEKICSDYHIGGSEKVYVDGTLVENRSKTIGELAGTKSAVSLSVVTKTNNARK